MLFAPVHPPLVRTITKSSDRPEQSHVSRTHATIHQSLVAPSRESKLHGGLQEYRQLGDFLESSDNWRLQNFSNSICVMERESGWVTSPGLRWSPTIGSTPSVNHGLALRKPSACH